MNGRRPISLPVALLVLAFFLLAGLAPPVPTCAGPKPAGSSGREKWTVILSPGPQSGVHWGGYHVTIAGYSESNGGNGKAESLRRAFKGLFHSKPWHLHGGPSRSCELEGYMDPDFQEPDSRRSGEQVGSRRL